MNGSESEQVLHVGNAHGAARNHAICSGALVVARVSGHGYPIGAGWSPESEETAKRLAGAWNATRGITTDSLAASGSGSVAVLLSLLREATGVGGVGKHEFERAGGWRERALQAMQALELDSDRFHLFEVEVECEDGNHCFFVSARGSSPEVASERGASRVKGDLRDRLGLKKVKVLAVEYQGRTQCDTLSEIEGMPIASTAEG